MSGDISPKYGLEYGTVSSYFRVNPHSSGVWAQFLRSWNSHWCLSMYLSTNLHIETNKKMVDWINKNGGYHGTHIYIYICMYVIQVLNCNRDMMIKIKASCLHMFTLFWSKNNGNRFAHPTMGDRDGRSSNHGVETSQTFHNNHPH